MAKKIIKLWYDPEGDYLEVIFEQKEGYFRETENDQVMEKVDQEGNILGFSVLKVSKLDKKTSGGCSNITRSDLYGASFSISPLIFQLTIDMPGV